MSFMPEKTCCESLNINCDQGRKCPHRKYTIQTVSDEIVMLEKPWQWLTDIFYTVVLLSGSAVISLLIVYFIVIATGLNKF